MHTAPHTYERHVGSRHHDPASAALAFAQTEAKQREEHRHQQRSRALLFAAGRVALSSVFLAAALAKATNMSTVASALEESGIPNARLALSMGLTVEFGCGLLLLLGVRARAA